MLIGKLPRQIMDEMIRDPNFLFARKFNTSCTIGRTPLRAYLAEKFERQHVLAPQTSKQVIHHEVVIRDDKLLQEVIVREDKLLWKFCQAKLEADAKRLPEWIILALKAAGIFVFVLTLSVCFARSYMKAPTPVWYEESTLRQKLQGALTSTSA